MALLLGLNPTSFSQLYCSLVKGVLHEFVKRSTFPEIKLRQYARADIFGIINAFYMFQDILLKHNHPVRVLLPSVYPVKLYRNDSKNILLTFLDSTL